MRNKSYYSRLVVNLSLLISIVSLFVGCAAKQHVTVEEKPAYFNELPLAAKHISASLSRQLESITEGAKPSIVVDTLFNEQSAEVSIAGRFLQGAIVESLSKGVPPWPTSILGIKTLQKAKLAVSGTYKLQPSDSKNEAKWIKIVVKAQNILTGQVVAQTEVFVDAKQFNAEPVKFYKDAPMYMGSARSKGANLGESLAVNAKLADAREAYENGNFPAAETLFKDVLTQVNGKNFIALSGLYQSLFRLNRLGEAENAFGRLVDFGLDSGNLSLKFLFKVGSTDFLAKDELSSQYPIWLRQIAQQLSAKKLCLHVNGHASRTGSQEYNERLSLHRAERIIVQLKKNVPALSSHLKAIGKGFKENMVGSGTNDAMDAIDRRVDFEVVGCN